MVSPRPIPVVICCVLLVTSAGISITTATNEGYEITPPNELETLEQTRTIEGETYTVDSTGYVMQGEELTLTVQTPGVDRYTVYLYTSDRQIEDRVDGTEDGSVTLDTAGTPPGSYVAVVQVDGVNREIQPVVISRYDIELDNTHYDMSSGSSMTVAATLASVSGSTDDPATVNVVVQNDTWRHAYSASADGDGYTADLPASLAAGEYSIYVTTHSDTEVNGHNEVTGISSPSTLSVEAPPSDTDTPESGSGGTDSDGTDTTDPDESRTETTTEPPLSTDNSGANTTTTTTPSDTPTDTPLEIDETPTPTDDNVIDPATPTATSTTETAAPGFPVLLFLLLVVTSGLMQLRSTIRP